MSRKKKVGAFFSIFLPLLMILLVSSSSTAQFAYAFSNGQPASKVIGQPNFTASAPAETRTGINNPIGVAFDQDGNLWLADFANNRVLEFRAPFSNGEGASIVIGQTTFTASSPAETRTGLAGPIGIAFDSRGNLWVADAENNRVLEFQPPFSNREKASIVIGQPDFVTSTPAETGSGLAGPSGIAFDSHGNLWVADTDNNRVLEFRAPLTIGEGASIVVGQPTFTASTPAVTSSGLQGPSDVAFDPHGNLWVADHFNNRVLEFRPPFIIGEGASVVIGQTTFTASSAAETRTGLDLPSGVAFDSHGNLWLGDTDNNRVLEFRAPFSNGERASVVIGQPNFTASTPAENRTGLHDPTFVAFDPHDNLWVADFTNNRVLEFTNTD